MNANLNMSKEKFKYSSGYKSIKESDMSKINIKDEEPVEK
jgi:hypothetical protein